MRHIFNIVARITVILVAGSTALIAYAATQIHPATPAVDLAFVGAVSLIAIVATAFALRLHRAPPARQLLVVLNHWIPAHIGLTVLMVGLYALLVAIVIDNDGATPMLRFTAPLAMAPFAGYYIHVFWQLKDTLRQAQLAFTAPRHPPSR